MPHDDVAILDIVKAAKLAIAFVHGMGVDGFTRDKKTQSAVLHQLLILGEAVKRLSAEFRAAHPDPPWALIAGMRGKLIHAYDEVDLDEVWRTVERDLPNLLEQTEPLIADESE